MSGSGRTLRTGLRFAGWAGVLATFSLLGGGTYWAATTEISGAVIAVGNVEVVGRPKSVQHLDGGIINDILVTDGARVAAGDVLMRLDDTTLRANVLIYKTRLSEALALRDRLIAEQTEAPDITFEDPGPLLAGFDVSLHRAGQTRIFRARQELETGRREQLAEKIAQFRNQITGVEGLITSKQNQLSFVAEEMASIKELTDKGLARASSMRSLQRNEAELLGQIAEHRSELARIQNSIRDTEIELLQGQRQTREEVVTELRSATTSIQELTQQITSTLTQLDRVDIRAPNSGRIHEMQFTTLGGVIPPGGVILQIIPLDDGFGFRTRVDPASIDQVFIGQTAKVRFPAFNQRTTPELTGRVTEMSATTSIDEVTGQTFYSVEIGVPEDELARLGARELIPGMPVEAFLTTTDRTVLSYLSKPLTDQINQAFREE